MLAVLQYDNSKLNCLSMKLSMTVQVELLLLSHSETTKTISELAVYAVIYVNVVLGYSFKAIQILSSTTLCTVYTCLKSGRHLPHVSSDCKNATLASSSKSELLTKQTNNLLIEILHYSVY